LSSDSPNNTVGFFLFDSVAFKEKRKETKKEKRKIERYLNPDWLKKSNKEKRKTVIIYPFWKFALCV